MSGGVVYRYQAVDRRGEQLRGWIEAPSKSWALNQLLGLGYLVLDLRERSWWEEILSGRKRRLSSRDRLLFFRPLGVLLEAGVPLLQALEAWRSKTNDKAVNRVVGDLYLHVLSGFSLWQAMEASRAFSGVEVHLVRCGEEAGMLDKVLLDLAQYLDKEENRRKTVVKAAAYPLFVALLAFLSVLFLLFQVMPSFEGFLQASNIPCPAWSRKISAAASLVPYLTLALLGLVGLSHYAGRVNKIKRFRDLALLKLPIGGDLLKMSELIRLARVLSLLIRAGVPLLQALSLGQELVTNSAMVGSLRVALSEVEKGGDMALSLSRGLLFDGVAGQLLSTGEEAGKLEAMLDKVAAYYEEEFNYRAEILLSLVQPLLILGLVSVIGLLILTLFLPALEAITTVQW